LIRRLDGHAELGSDDLLEKLYEFVIKEKTISINANTEYKEDPAEIIMVQTKDKTLFKGAEIRFLDGSGTLRIELWKHIDLVLFYQYSNGGYRSLIIVSEDEKEKVIGEFQEALQRYSGQVIKFYQDA
jgi:hypothetical protein